MPEYVSHFKNKLVALRHKYDLSWKQSLRHLYSPSNFESEPVGGAPLKRGLKKQRACRSESERQTKDDLKHYSNALKINKVSKSLSLPELSLPELSL